MKSVLVAVAVARQTLRHTQCVFGAATNNMTTATNAETTINVRDGLTLYYHRYSFYSQKVLLALYEKQLPFEHRVIEITKGEQYKPWFLQLNPRGEVPVLQHGDKIVPDSAKIIDYLEDYFNDSDSSIRLIPLDPATRQKVTHFRRIIDQLPVAAITMGSFMHPELSKNYKAPFYKPVRKILLEGEKKNAANLRATAELNPDFSETILSKAESQDKKHEIISNKNEFLQLLEQTEAVLAETESQLASKDTTWLCSTDFTAADISLAILLYRLDSLGLSHRFWSDENNPNVLEYYKKVQERDSYKQTVPGMRFHIKTILANTPKPLMVGLGVGITVVIIVIGVLSYKYV